MTFDSTPSPQSNDIEPMGGKHFGIWLFLPRLGFLGLLHMEVFNQRLEQEYNASVILTTPTVPYKAVLSSAKLIKVLL